MHKGWSTTSGVVKVVHTTQELDEKKKLKKVWFPVSIFKYKQYFPLWSSLDQVLHLDFDGTWVLAGGKNKLKFWNKADRFSLICFIFLLVISEVSKLFDQTFTESWWGLLGRALYLVVAWWVSKVCLGRVVKVKVKALLFPGSWWPLTFTFTCFRHLATLTFTFTFRYLAGLHVQLGRELYLGSGFGT